MDIYGSASWTVTTPLAHSVDQYTALFLRKYIDVHMKMGMYTFVLSNELSIQCPGMAKSLAMPLQGYCLDASVSLTTGSFIYACLKDLIMVKIDFYDKWTSLLISLKVE